ncbi:MAG: 3'-5' exonuclease [Gemmatimonadota bacterium]|nr:3'-5' exonuclease [Gemmatimonadota bacterium]MDE2872641.1 3'-5' exonuclease [Gemmatimonadota bacterium]
MKLPVDLDRPVIFFDLETTGLSLARDRIVELAVLRVSPQGDVFERVRRYNPGIPIPAEAAAVHGITDDAVANEPSFRRTAKSLAKLLEPCDLAGFNIRRFDLPILLAEFRRAGVPFDVKGRRLIDMKMIFHREEPRDLSAAARFYLARDHQDAHTALGDIRTTAAVLTAQLARYQHLPRDMEGLHAYCDEMGPFLTEFDRWFSRKGGGLVFNRGKHRGTPLDEVAAKAPDYLEWMMGADDMPDEVLEAVGRALAGTGRS